MSRPFSRYLHPFDTLAHPAYEPEVASAKLASWALDLGVPGSIGGRQTARDPHRNARLAAGFRDRVSEPAEGRAPL